MTEVRSRKHKAQKRDDSRKKITEPEKVPPADSESEFSLITMVSLLLGVIVMVALGYGHAKYMATIHENWMWFSNIKVLFTLNGYSGFCTLYENF